MTLNDTWGYSKFDERWKSAQQLIRTLVDTTSKNGNFLLNVGPDGAGVIPSGSVERLRAVGKWMAVNGASIYGGGAANLPQPPWGRITAQGRKIYLHVYHWPADGNLTVTKFPGPVKQAYRLADPSRRALSTQLSAEVLTISVESEAPNELSPVIVLEW